MSVVAIKNKGKGKFEIAADSQTTSGSTLSTEKSTKLYKTGDIIVGHVGLCSLSYLFREYIENHRPKTNNEYGWINLMAEFMKYAVSIDSSFKADQSYFLVIWKHRAFSIKDFYVNQVKRFDSIGAGADFALAAMHLGHSAKKACEIACQLSIYCGKPVKTITT